MSATKRNGIPLADAKEEIGSSGNDNHYSQKSDNNDCAGTGRGTVEINEMEKLMIFGMGNDSDEVNSC